MTRTEKLLGRLTNTSGDFTWNELETLLGRLGYHKSEGRGSRVKFSNGHPSMLISLHRPHPGNKVKHYVRNQITEVLENGGLL